MGDRFNRVAGHCWWVLGMAWMFSGEYPRSAACTVIGVFHIVLTLHRAPAAPARGVGE